MRERTCGAKRSLGRGVAVVAAVLVAAGCTTAVRSPLEQEITKRVTAEKQQFDLIGWTDRTGAHHKLRGRARIMGDSIQFYERHYPTSVNPNPPTKLVATVPRSDVIQVEVQKFSPAKTGILLLTPVVAFYVLVIIAYSSDPS